MLELPEHGFAPFDEVRFAPAALDLLFRVAQTGWKIYLIGNEDAVARGAWRDTDWLGFERALLEHLQGLGIAIGRNYACLEDPVGGNGAHKKGSVFRLPDTGIFFHASQVDGIALRHSFVIGDSTLEIAAGARAGCRTIGVRTGNACRDGLLSVEPDVHIDDLGRALELFLKSEACSSY